MEGQLNTMNTILQNMQQALKCNICLDMLNKPLTTKCGHSFCGECVHQLVKRPRGSAQCPLCLGPITRRSLSHNVKVAALVLAVRRVIASIKKDCCFEVTPSKYRPRPRPEAALEEDDSENEEKDEPRRGTRKRGATALYNPQVVPPRPRPRPAKRRILAANGAQELSLHSEATTTTTTTTTEGQDSRPGELDLLDTIARDHSYSSPTKQAPLERPSVVLAPPSSRRGRGRGRGGGGGGGQAMYLGPRKIDEKNGDDLVSASQEDLVLPGEEVGGQGGVGVGQGGSLPSLGRQRAEDKVAKWLDNSREVGFRIGLTHSTSTPSNPLQSSGYPGSSLSTTAATDTPSTSAPSTGGPSTTTSAWKFFKSKVQNNTSGATHTSDSQDTYTFIPSQKTGPRQPPKNQRGRGRGRGTSVGLGRVRGRGRGATRPPEPLVSAPLQQSTPMARLKAHPPLEVSAIHPPGESVIVYAHDDDDDLPDSCPVNTLDHFDRLVADTKENNPPNHRPDAAPCLAACPAPPQASQEDKEAGLLFVTPAQDPEPPQDTEGCDASPGKDGRDRKDARPGREGRDLRGGRQAVREEALAQELLAGVEDHDLTLVTPREEEEARHRHHQQREAVLREDLSLLNLTHDNTLHNKTLPVPVMAAPAAAPGGRRRVHFNANATDGDSEKLQKPRRANTRYVPTLKQRLVDTGRPGTAAVSLKSARSAKSPGWSHIEGARKDLVPRNTSLNITGGEGLAEGRGKKGQVVSSLESLSIEDTQYDVEHLPLSQAKKERVQRLKDIVSRMCLPHKSEQRGEGQPPDTAETDRSVLGAAGGVGSGDAGGGGGDSYKAKENTKQEDMTEKTQKLTKKRHVLGNQQTDLHSTTGTTIGTHTDSILIGNKKQLKLSLQKLIPAVERKAQTSPYIVKDTEREAEKLSPSPRHTANSRPVLRRNREREGVIDRATGTTDAGRETKGVTEGNEGEKCYEQERMVVKRRNSARREVEKEKNDETKEEELEDTVMAKKGKENEGKVEKESLEAKEMKKSRNRKMETFEGRKDKKKKEDEKQSDDSGEMKEEENKLNEREGKILEARKRSRETDKSKKEREKERETDKQNKPTTRTHTEPFSLDEQHSDATAGEKQPDTARSQKPPASQPQPNTAKRKDREKETQHEVTQQLEQDTDAPPGKRVRQGGATDPHSTDSDTARPQRKTFSFSTDTEDLNSLIDSTTTHTTAPQHTVTGLPHLTPLRELKPQRSVCVSSPAAHSITATSGKGAVASALWSSASCDPRMTSTQQERARGGHAVVPFKAVGRLCTERCLEAGEGARMGGGGALRDLCLHTVPCEVYQVLMKYIGLLETQAPQHSVCCGKSVQQPDQHQQRQPPPPPPPPPTVTTTMTATAATTEAPPATTAATEAPKTAAASQPEGVCAAAAGSPAPAPTQAPGLRGESEPLFESEVVEGSCSSQDMALALPLGGAGLGGTHVGAGTEGRAAGASQGQEQLSEVFGLLPEALGNALARSAASQASQESVSLLAECGAVLGPGRAEQDSRVAEQAERRGGGVGRARERAGVGHRTATAAQTEVEKENVGGQPPGRPLGLRRKDPQAARPVLEDILTQRGGQEEQAPSQKASLPPTSKPVLSLDTGRGRGQRGEAAQGSEGSGAEDGTGRPAGARLSSRRRFRRIARPPSSSSSSSDSDDAPPGPTPSLTHTQAPAAATIPTQHLLDSEEMRDLERLDQNVWAEFGRPEDFPKDNPQEDPLQDPTQDLQEEPRPASTTTTTTASLSATTRRVVDRASRCLARVEDFLGPGSLSQPPATPPSPDVVQATDDEEEEEKGRKTTEEEEEETQSHGSTQSEPLTTQRHNQMKAEIDALRRRKEEVMAALVKKSEEKGVQDVAASQVDSLASTCPFNEEDLVEDLEGDQDLFPSNPGGDDLPSPPLTPRQPTPPPPPPPLPPVSKRERTPRASLTITRSQQNKGQRKRCLVFSGLGLAERRCIQESLQTLEKLGLRVRAAWGAEVTHVVVHTEGRVAPRTLKYLQGVASGCWVVSQMWVLDSLQRGRLMPEEAYEVVDETGEDGPARSRKSHTHLLEACQVCVMPPFEDMTPEQVKELAEMAGARVVASPKGFTQDPGTFTILLLDSEREEAGREAMARHGHVAVGHNWLVDSITAHQLASLPEHLLAGPPAGVLQASRIPPALMGSQGGL